MCDCEERTVEEGMQRYRVRWLETSAVVSCTLLARSKEEAEDIVKRGDVLDFSEDVETAWFGDVIPDSVEAELAEEKEYDDEHS